MNKETGLIFLCGFMGSGKTTVGRMLAEHLGYAFMDTDHEIEKKENKPVKEIFEQNGENYFRICERDMISVLVHSQAKTVVALGGGLLMDRKNLAIVSQHGYLIYLKTGLRTTSERLKDDRSRPLLQKGELEKLLQQREPGYQKAAWIIETNDLSSETVAKEIYHHLLRLGPAVKL